MRRGHRPEPFAPISPNIVRAQHSRASIKVPHASVAADGAMDARVHDDHTAQSLSSLEQDTTDDFGKLLMQHARDEQRMRDTLEGKVRPFSKARPRQRGRLTLTDLERSLVEKENSFEQRRLEREASFVGLSSPPESVSSGESRHSEPSLNIPREWGRKARKGTGWLRRSVDLDRDALEPESTARDNYDTPGDVNWAEAAADIPIPTTEGSPSPFRYARGTPPSIQKRDDAAARAKGWDINEDFTSASFLASTPALPRNTVLDDIRLRELETVTEASVLSGSRDRSSRLSTSPIQRSVSRSAERRTRRTNQQSTSGAWTHPAEQKLDMPKHSTSGPSQQGIDERRRARGASPGLESSPIVVYKSADAPEDLLQRSQQRPRVDSHNLLQRLARAASGTPSPQHPAPQRPSTGKVPTTDGPPPSSDVPQPVTASNPSKRVQLSNDSAETRPQPEQSDNAIASSSNKAKNLSGREKAGNAVSSVDSANPQTPLPGHLQVEKEPTTVLNAKTPVVMGAWIDTPAPATVKRVATSPTKTRFSPSKKRLAEQAPASRGPGNSTADVRGLPTPDPSKSPEAQKIPNKPSLPSSALAAVLSDARAHSQSVDAADSYNDQEQHNFGDSTINSLEDLMDTSLAGPSADETDTLTLPSLPGPDTMPKNAAEKQRWKEMEQVARMNSQLRAARSNIRDARVGLRRFENAVMAGDGEQPQQQATTGHAEGCDTCGCHGGARAELDFSSLGRLFLSLIIYPVPQRSATNAVDQNAARRLSARRPRLTWLGLFLLIISFYTALEYALCAQYCQPRYARYMVGYGVNPNAPQFPFVIPTMLYRPFDPILGPPARFIAANGKAALQAYGLLEEDEVWHPPWEGGRRPPMTEEEQANWHRIAEMLRKRDGQSVTGWVAKAATLVEKPVHTAARWAQTVATAAAVSVGGKGDDAIGMGQDEVL